MNTNIIVHFLFNIINFIIMRSDTTNIINSGEYVINLMAYGTEIALITLNLEERIFKDTSLKIWKRQNCLC